MTRKLVLDGDPVSWARPRFNNGRGFTAPKQASAKTDLQWMFYQQWKSTPILRPNVIIVRMEFFFKARRLSDVGRHKTTTPDLDNLAKLVLDAANGILWEDDAQVADLMISKRYAKEAHTIIDVRVLE